ncbi:MAG: hypothetical protein JSR39_11410, partial [Verrucomicrobia bacterium]|nr:hypothetical protein [Verrucomicrobiota bacterium]
MSLKTRLFLLISSLFLCFAVISSFMETYVMKRGIAKSQENMRNQIFKLNEQNREGLENFVKWLLADTDTNINAVLNHTTNLRFENLRYGPTEHNIKKGTWLSSSELLLNFNWIDFLQSNIPHQEATIVPHTDAINASYRIPINEDLAWVFFQGNPQPYLAILVPYQEDATRLSFQDPSEIVSGIDPRPYLLFDVQKLMQGMAKPLPAINLPPISLPWAEHYFFHLNGIPAVFNKAQSLLASHSLKPPLEAYEQIQKSIETGLAAQGGNYFKIPSRSLLKTPSIDLFLEAHLESIIERYTEVNLIWILMTIFHCGMFGDELFSFPAPV